MRFTFRPMILFVAILVSSLDSGLAEHGFRCCTSEDCAATVDVPFRFGDKCYDPSPEGNCPAFATHKCAAARCCDNEDCVPLNPNTCGILTVVECKRSNKYECPIEDAPSPPSQPVVADIAKDLCCQHSTCGKYGGMKRSSGDHCEPPNGDGTCPDGFAHVCPRVRCCNNQACGGWCIDKITATHCQHRFSNNFVCPMDDQTTIEPTPAPFLRTWSPTTTPTAAPSASPVTPAPSPLGILAPETHLCCSDTSCGAALGDACANPKAAALNGRCPVDKQELCPRVNCCQNSDCTSCNPFYTEQECNKNQRHVCPAALPPNPQPPQGITPAPTNSTKVNRVGKGTGDPHFVMLSGHKFDFHGGCDLVFLATENIRIHIRTTIETWYSYISAVVIQVGHDKLEVMGGPLNGDMPRYWINGVQGSSTGVNDGILSESGLKIHYHKVSPKQSKYRIVLASSGDAISIATYNEVVSVIVKAKTADTFGDAVGLMGSFLDGQMMSRDQSTVIQDPIAFGKEWQVWETEPMLFHSIEGAQHPTECAMPDLDWKKRRHLRRRLGEALVTREDAEEACAHAAEDEQDDCAFDVLAMNDLGIASTYDKTFL